MIVHEEKVRNNINMVNEVRELKSIGCSNSEISRRIGLDTRTIRGYLDENFNPVHPSYGEKKDGLLKKYKKDINSMLEKGIMGTKKPLEKCGLWALLQLFALISDWKRRRIFFYENANEISIGRKDIFKLLFHPIEKIKIISKEYFQKI